MSKNDVYVVFKVGTKKCKTKYIPGSGKNVRFPETLVMNLSDADMAQGVDMVAYDYDFGSSDDMLGVGKLTNLEALKRCPDQPRGFETKFLYKGKARGENCPYNAEHMRGGQLLHQWCRCSGARLIGHVDPMSNASAASVQQQKNLERDRKVLFQRKMDAAARVTARREVDRQLLRDRTQKFGGALVDRLLGHHRGHHFRVCRHRSSSPAGQKFAAEIDEPREND